VQVEGDGDAGPLALVNIGHAPGNFDDPDWLFEVKADAFQGLLYIAPLAEALARKLKVQSAILDGEVVVKEAAGR
jgi:hypothetical protein